VTIYDKLKSGLPIDNALVIDEHCHPEYYYGGYQPIGSPEEIVRVMDKLGIDISCLSHCGAFVDQKWGNDRVALALDSYPNRFIGYVTINPQYPDETLPELARCFANKKFLGIKIHPWCHDRPMSYKNYEKVYEYAAKNDKFIMSHTYNPDDVNTTSRLAAEYPNVNFIMGHMGGYFPCIEQAVGILTKHENVYGDISGSESREGVVEWMVKEAGPKRIIFGTDMCCMDGRATLAMVCAAEIDEDAKRDILGLNMMGILEASGYKPN